MFQAIENIHVKLMPPKILHMKYGYSSRVAADDELFNFIYTNGHKCTIEFDLG
jgi:hypothetical protein